MLPVVLAAGNPRRMLPLNEGHHKFLLKVAGNPIFLYSLKSLLDVSGGRSLLVIDRDMPQEEVQKSLTARKLQDKVDLVIQKGSSLEEALRQVIDEASEEWFLVTYGDVIAPADAFKLMIKTHEETQRPVALVIPRPEVTSYGVAYVSGKSLKKVISPEKAHGEAIDTSFVLGGVFILPRQTIDLLNDGNNFYEAMNYLIERMGIEIALWSGSWVSVDYPWDLISALYEVLGADCKTVISPRAKVSPLAVLEGCVIVEDDAFIDHYAVIRGPAYIGRGALVGKGAFVREFTSLEEGSVVGAHTEVKRSILQEKATAGSFSLITDSVLGPQSVAEPRTTVISDLPSDRRVLRPLPLQGILYEKQKLGVFLAPRGRIKAGSIVGPGVKIFRDGGIEHI
jgi:glucose-1-phosphate thymidylyltransferase